MKQVAVIGCGLIGRAWAISFLRAGCHVSLWDPEPGAADTLLSGLPETLDALRSRGLLAEETAALLARAKPAGSLAEALGGADYVQENTPEQAELKRALFRGLETLAAPEAILASSTSGILPSVIFEGLDSGHRCLVAHPINPPYLVPAVEIVPGPATRPDVIRAAAAFLEEAGQAPIVMTREIEGFVMNRLQGALLQEAFRLVQEGLASPEDVDRGIRDGLALRWSFMGPFETIDLNAPEGVRDYIARYGGMYRRIFDNPSGATDWDGPALDRIEAHRRAEVAEQDLAARRDWRDHRLMALAAWKVADTKEE